MAYKILENPSDNEPWHTWPLFLKTNGQYASFAEIKEARKLTTGSKGDPIADKLMHLDKTIVILANPDFLLEEIKPYLKSCHEESVSQLAKNESLDLGSKTIDLSDLKSRERKRLGRIRKLMELGHENDDHGIDIRDLRVMESTMYDGFTDGRTYISLNRSILNSSKREYLGKALHVLAHELAHSQESFKSDNHSPEFYERFHKIHRTLSKFALYLITREEYIN
jgi:hypothetical protein